MSEPLRDYSITHGGIQSYLHPELKAEVNGQTAVRYLRFGNQVKLDRLELPAGVYGRWVPAVPTHPRHLILSIYETKKGKWKVVREVTLPRDPRIEGKGLSQKMTAEEMEAKLSEVMKKKPHVIRLNGLVTDHLRVECDREYPTWPSHGEVNGGEYNVPYGILHPLKAYGKVVRSVDVAAYRPCLKQKEYKPRAPRGMKVRELPDRLLFEGPKFSVGFSLKRPMLLQLGWNAFANGQAPENRLRDTQALQANIGGLSGPVIRTNQLDCQPHHWTGDVSVIGNRVSYQNLHCNIPGIRIDAVFTVEADRLLVELKQKVSHEIPVIEASAWRWIWDLSKSMTSAVAVPTLRPGRNGEVQLPMMWGSDGMGCLSCRTLEGASKDVRMEVESYRTQSCIAGGVSFGRESIPAGERRVTLELAVTKLEPKTEKKLNPGLASHWGTIYTCFRPEFGGFSNHAASCNCHVNQHCPSEIAAFTRVPKHGPDPLELYRFTIERALMGGAGYGYFRNLYMDSSPVLVSGAGRIHQTKPDLKWLRRIEPGLVDSVKQMLGTFGKEGLVVCRALSGNGGSFRWSSNAYDVVGFGHIDGYVNALTYRALRNGAALLEDLGRKDMASECREKAALLRTAYPKYLINPKTGWVGGWRSRDGELHDYAFVWVNGFACAFGLLDQATGAKALKGLEKLRSELGMQSGIYGVPANLWPIRRNDHMLPQAMYYFPTTPTFEFYTDGAMTGHFSGYYLRSLSLYGLKKEAKKLADDMEIGYASNVWIGGHGSGKEFHSWDGMSTGYEGTFVGNFSPLYSIGIEKGLFQPTTPEWWPANG